MLVDLVATTTRDGVRLDGAYVASAHVSTLPFEAVCFVHGTGGSFYTSTLFDDLAAWFLDRGCAVLRVNTRGHDGISTASTARGGRRLGAAYETVDDCRHDLLAWYEWLRDRAGPRVALLGHSLGGVKALYTAAHEPSFTPSHLLAISPPRLAYSVFCTSPTGPAFLELYAAATQFLEAGKPAALLEVSLPLPMVICAAGYVEKYGPEERYDYVRLLPSVKSPTLLTLGGKEVESNMAFRGAADGIAALGPRAAGVCVEVVPGADHGYTGVRAELLRVVGAWLGATQRTGSAASSA